MPVNTAICQFFRSRDKLETHLGGQLKHDTKHNLFCRSYCLDYGKTSMPASACDFTYWQKCQRCDRQGEKTKKGLGKLWLPEGQFAFCGQCERFFQTASNVKQKLWGLEYREYFLQNMQKIYFYERSSVDNFSYKDFRLALNATLCF